RQYLEWLTNVLEQLQKEGFSAVLPFYPNKFGDPFVLLEKSSYYVLPWIEDRVEEKYKPSWEVEMLDLLAEMHQKTVRTTSDPCPLKPLSLNVLERRWKRRLRKMEEYKQFAEERVIL